MKNVSIKDIAKQAGVSTTTVSFVLNGKAEEKRISPDLKNKILKLAQKLNYKPNQLARGLRTGSTQTVALIVEDISNIFFANISKVIEYELDRFGYRLMYCSTENNDKKAVAIMEMLLHRQIDGFIITPTRGIRKILEELAANQAAMVLIDRYFPDLPISYVAVDNYAGAYQSVEFMINQGYSNIGIVTIEYEQVQMERRYQGYEDALRAHDIPIKPNLIQKIPFGLAAPDAVETISNFVIREPEMNAIFFTTNYLGTYGIESLKRLRRNIPSDMAVICFDDSDLFRLNSPSITVVRQPFEEIGHNAVRIILDQLLEKSRELRQVILTPSLIIRESVMQSVPG